MRRHAKRWFREKERGSVAVLVAVSLTALMGLAALGTDVGRLYVEKQRLASVADAAALAGANHLPGSPGTAQQVAVQILQQNGVSANASVISITHGQRRIAVDVTRTVSMTFGRVVGVNQSAVSGGATVEVANLSGYYGAAPLGVPRANWKLGERVTLKLDSSTGTIAPGSYMALALGKSGASMYEQNLMTGYKEWIRVDDWVSTESGNMAGPTVRALNYRIGLDPNATWENVAKNSPRQLLVPIVRDFNVNGRGEVLVVGFGLFFLEAASGGSNNQADIVGRFLRFAAVGEGSLTAPDYGVYTIKLVR